MDDITLIKLPLFTITLQFLSSILVNVRKVDVHFRSSFPADCERTQLTTDKWVDGVGLMQLRSISSPVISLSLSESTSLSWNVNLSEAGWIAYRVSHISGSLFIESFGTISLNHLITGAIVGETMLRLFHDLSSYVFVQRLVWGLNDLSQVINHSPYVGKYRGIPYRFYL